MHCLRVACSELELVCQAEISLMESRDSKDYAVLEFSVGRVCDKPISFVPMGLVSPQVAPGIWKRFRNGLDTSPSA